MHGSNSQLIWSIKIQQFQHYSLKKNYNFNINKGEK